jgi:peptide deformylase
MLRNVAIPVVDFRTSELPGLIDDMFETMRSGKGVGLAAPQIGVSQRIIVFEFGGGDRSPGTAAIPPTVLVNPIITASEGVAEDWEGCFSVPGYRGQVPRFTRIRFVAQDATGVRIEGEAEHFHARILQHEIDHLNGVLYTDTAHSMEMYERPIARKEERD